MPWTSIVNGEAGLTKPVSAIPSAPAPVAQDRHGVVVDGVTGHPSVLGRDRSPASRRGRAASGRADDSRGRPARRRPRPRHRRTGPAASAGRSRRRAPAGSGPGSRPRGGRMRGSPGSRACSRGTGEAARRSGSRRPLDRVDDPPRVGGRQGEDLLGEDVLAGLRGASMTSRWAVVRVVTITPSTSSRARSSSRSSWNGTPSSPRRPPRAGSSSQAATISRRDGPAPRPRSPSRGRARSPAWRGGSCRERTDADRRVAVASVARRARQAGHDQKRGSSARWIAGRRRGTARPRPRS